MFADEGDSGACVVQASGVLVGMVMGGSLDGKITYVTPIDAVFEDIEVKTGWAVLI